MLAGDAGAPRGVRRHQQEANRYSTGAASPLQPPESYNLGSIMAEVKRAAMKAPSD
jgi:hypothetical protein